MSIHVYIYMYYKQQLPSYWVMSQYCSSHKFMFSTYMYTYKQVFFLLCPTQLFMVIYIVRSRHRILHNGPCHPLPLAAWLQGLSALSLCCSCVFSIILKWHLPTDVHFYHLIVKWLHNLHLYTKSMYTNLSIMYVGPTHVRELNDQDGMLVMHIN